MYQSIKKMIIADDEHIILKGLRNLLDWRNLGIEIIGEASDGKMLMDMILSMEPDIVVSDICMPNMSGLDVLKIIKENNLSTKVILISGYEDFQYAREALKNGAVDYLLKPIDDLALKNNILSIIQSDETPVTTSSRDKDDTEDYTNNYFCVLLLRCNSVLSTHTVYQYITKKNIVDATVIKYHGNICVIFQLDSVYKNDVKIEKTAQELLDTITNELKIYAVGAMGKKFQGTKGIINSTKDAEIVMQYSYFFDIPKIYYKRDKNLFKGTTKSNIRELLEKLTMDINELNEENAKSTFGAIAEIIKNESSGIKDIAIMRIYSVIDHIRNTLKDEDFEKMYDAKVVLDALNATDSYSKVIDYVNDMISEISKRVSASKKQRVVFEIRKIKDYIEQNLNDNIKLETVAKMAFMNTYYLSVFFKKHTGENFKDYVIRLKMEKALYYVKETDMKMYEIAAAVGFNDDKHFGKAFKKYFGENAMELRRNR